MPPKFAIIRIFILALFRDFINCYVIFNKKKRNEKCK